MAAKNIEQHTLMMSSEITLADIRSAHEARLAAYEYYEESRESRERQAFDLIRNFISPRLYDEELDHLRLSICEATGYWLAKHLIIRKWLDINDTSARVVWMQGIPGSGRYNTPGSLLLNSNQLQGKRF